MFQGILDLRRLQGSGQRFSLGLCLVFSRLLLSDSLGRRNCALIVGTLLRGVAGVLAQVRKVLLHGLGMGRRSGCRLLRVRISNPLSKAPVIGMPDAVHQFREGEFSSGSRLARSNHLGIVFMGRSGRRLPARLVSANVREHLGRVVDFHGQRTTSLPASRVQA